MATLSKQTRRQRAAQKRQRQSILWIGGAAVFAVLIILMIVFGIRSQRPVGSEQVLRTQGNAHIAEDAAAPISYNSTPPTSGPHYGSLVPWGISQEPQRYERVLHNLEDGGVAIYYQCEEGCEDLVEQLEEAVAPYLRSDRHVLLLPNDPAWRIGNSQPLQQDMGNRIALAAWQRLDKFDNFDAARIDAFIERYEGIDHHQ